MAEYFPVNSRVAEFAEPSSSTGQLLRCALQLRGELVAVLRLIWS